MVFRAIIEVWQGKDVKEILKKYQQKTSDLSGYNLDYILYALNGS